MPLPLADDDGRVESEVAQLGERGCFVRDGFLGTALALAVTGEALALDYRAAGMGRAGAAADPSLRGDQLSWLSAGGHGPALSALETAFAALGAELARAAYLGLCRHDIQLARYPGAGERYARHRDAFRDAAGANRRLTAILYLNPGWSTDHGGLLRLHLGEAAVDIEPILDRLVVFLSDRVEHEVLPAHHRRLAATAFYYGP